MDIIYEKKHKYFLFEIQNGSLLSKQTKTLDMRISTENSVSVLSI